MNPVIKRWLTPVILLIAVFGIYRQVIEHNFTYFDDNAYVFRNEDVLGGLSWHSVRWAFTTTEVANYHPLTWLSHMLDVQVYGLWAGGHAFTNLLLHAANVLLVWQLVRRLSGKDSVGFLVAMLFAVHPLNVESVASISQRKTVLSACFGLLSLLAYLSYVDRGGKRHYCWSLFAATLSLLAKPLFVTLPAMLLLLDYWPLAKFKHHPTDNSSATRRSPALQSLPVNWLPLVVEKIPFLLLAGASGFSTYYAQHAAGAMNTAQVDGITSLAGAFSSYFFYLKKLFWPSGLAVFYPIPESLPLALLLISAFVLLLFSGASWSIRRSRPYVLFGWLWFVGTLVPMAGFVRVGGMAMADRYAYIPLLGIFLVLAALAVEWWDHLALKRKGIREFLLVCGLSSLVGLAIVAHRQVEYWRTTARLFARVMSLQGAHPPLLHLMGFEAFDQGDFARAIPFFQKILVFDPKNATAASNLGIALVAVNRLEEAEPWLELAAKLRNPQSIGVLNARGIIAEHQGRIEEACKLWQSAIATNPTFGEARINLANVLAKNHKPDEALAILDVGIRITPWNDRLYSARADILEQTGRNEEAQAARDQSSRQREENSVMTTFLKSTPASAP